MGPSPQLHRPGIGAGGLDTRQQLDPFEPLRSPVVGCGQGIHRLPGGIERQNQVGEPLRPGRGRQLTHYRNSSADRADHRFRDKFLNEAS